MGRCEDVLLRHKNAGAACGDPHGRGERVIQQEVVALNVKATIRPVDLPPHTLVPGLQSGSSAGWEVGKELSIPLKVILALHVHGGERAGAVRVQGLERQLVRQLLVLLSSVEAAGVTVSDEVQLSLRAEARAGEGRRPVRDQGGDVDRRGVRRVQEGQGGREEEMEEQEQVSEAGALTWRRHGDGKHCNDRK